MSGKKKVSGLAIVCNGLLCLFILGIAVLLLADFTYLSVKGLSFGDVLALLSSPRVIRAMRMSVATSIITLILIMLTAIPIGYALSRYRFPGHVVANTFVDVPIVLPPIVIGISLLAFFSFGWGQPIKAALDFCNLSLVSGIGIVLCQYLVSISYCIRSAKAAFDGVDHELEAVARVMGCSEWSAFCRVSLPLARTGLIAGLVMAWARSIGVFGPLMVFVGTGPRVMVMPTTLWLELSIGNIEVSIAVALIMLVVSCSALTLVHWLSPKGTAI